MQVRPLLFTLLGIQPRDSEAPPPAREARVRVVLALMAIGLVPRLLYALPKHVCFGDEACYLWLARNLFSGLGYTYYGGAPELHFPPLFPIVLGAFNWLVRDWEIVSRVVYVVLGTLLPLPVYLLAKEMYGKRVGFVAGFLVAVLPAYTSGILYAETLGEPLYLLCLFTGLYCLYRASVRLEVWSFGLAGAAISLAYLTRPEGLMYAGLGAVYLTAFFLVRRPLRFPGAGLRLVVFAGSFLAVASPYVFYLHAHTGQLALTTKTATSYLTTRGLVHHDGITFQRDTWGLNAEGEIKYFSHQFDRGLIELLTGPYRDRVLQDLLANLVSLKNALLNGRVFGRWLLLLSALGFVSAVFFHSLRNRPWANVLNLLVLSSVSVVLLFFVSDRFLYGPLLALILWAACGVDEVFAWIEGRMPRLRPIVLQVSVLALLAVYLTVHGYNHARERTAERAEVWPAAAWLKENTPAQAVVMATGPEVAFHAGRRWLPAPVAPRTELVSYGRERGATHLCLRGRYLKLRPEQRAELFDEARSHGDLELLAREGELSGRCFVVYRLKEAARE